MRQSAVARPAVLLEREHEVERVGAVLDEVAGGAGRALAIEAPAGMGKSRLLEDARIRAEELGFRVLGARATELEQGFPFGVMRQLFERPLGEADADERDRWLAGAAALAADVLTGAPRTGSRAPPAGSSGADPGYALQHGLYWLASNLASDAPLALIVDDLQWCDALSASALAFLARRLEGQQLALILATRPLKPALMPEAATLVADPATEVLRPAPLTELAIRALIAARLSDDPHESFVRACLDVTGGNPFLAGQLLDEVAARDLRPTVAAAAELDAIVPRGVANAVLLRLARLAPSASALARALSVLGDGAHVGDAALLAELVGSDVEAAMTALTTAGVVESGATVRFVHPILRTAIYGDLSSAERERLHRAAAAILCRREAPAGEVAAQVMYTEPAADPEAVALLREAARVALALGDPAGAAAMLSRGLKEPPAEGDRAAVTLELGQARARAGSPDAIVLLSEIVERGEDAGMVAVAAIELSSMLLFAGRAAEGVPILRRARERLPAEHPAREQLEITLLGVSWTSESVRREADATVGELLAFTPPPRAVVPATTLVTLALEEMFRPRSAAAAIDFAARALGAGLPPEPHRAWSLAAVAVLTVAEDFDAAQRNVDEMLAEARERGAALTVASVLAHRAFVELRRGDLPAAEADAQAVMELALDLVGSEFALVLAVPVAVLAGLDRGEAPGTLRGLIERAGLGEDSELMANSQLRYASALVRAAADDHEAAISELRTWVRDHPRFGGENPAAVPWRSVSALSLARLGREEEARGLAAEEVRRAQAFGAPRAIGIALRAQAIVGPGEERPQKLEEALAVLAPSPARLERARVLVDLGAARRALGQRSAAREPLLDGLALAARCGARALERRARAELGAIGVRPRTTDRSGTDSLTPSERRVVELAADGGTNRQIAQTLFITEKTVETHLGHAFRKLDVSSRRQLPDVLARAAG
jgi:DNA-binding CsgD family transcriptional regulator